MVMLECGRCGVCRVVSFGVLRDEFFKDKPWEVPATMSLDACGFDEINDATKY